MTTTCANGTIITAAPLLLASLDHQIKMAGGRGFNCDVHVEEIARSFAVRYHFDTEDGPKILQTLNTFSVGVIRNEPTRHIEFNADTGAYELLTVHERKGNMSIVLSIDTLGFSFNQMKKTVTTRWPNLNHANLTEPPAL